MFIDTGKWNVDWIFTCIVLVFTRSPYIQHLISLRYQLREISAPFLWQEFNLEYTTVEYYEEIIFYKPDLFCCWLKEEDLLISSSQFRYLKRQKPAENNLFTDFWPPGKFKEMIHVSLEYEALVPKYSTFMSDVYYWSIASSCFSMALQLEFLNFK